MTTKNLVAPHMACLSALASLSTSSQKDMHQALGIGQTIAVMKLKSEHVNEVLIGIDKQIAAWGRTQGRHAVAMIKDLSEARELMVKHNAIAQNGAGEAHRTPLPAAPAFADNIQA